MKKKPTKKQAKAARLKTARVRLAALLREREKEFNKIRTMSDVQLMAKRSLVRYSRWQALQHQIAALHTEIGK